MKHFPDAESLMLYARIHGTPDYRHCRVKLAYEIWRLWDGPLDRLIMMGRRNGIEISDERSLSDGWFIRRGKLVLSGNWAAVRLFLKSYADLITVEATWEQ